MLDYYQLLGVTVDAKREDIRAAYRILVARAHPDVNASADAQRQTALLNEAWSVLRDAETRAAYDVAGLATSAALRCQRCSKDTPNLRFVVFARARGAERPWHDGVLVCSRCRARESRESAVASVLRGRFTSRRRRRLTFGAIARDVRGGKVDPQTSAALLRQIGFAYARKNRSAEALTALEAVLTFGPDAAVGRIVARLREAGATPILNPARGTTTRRYATTKALQLDRSVLTAAAVLLVIILAGWLGLAHGPATSAPIARRAAQVAVNVDPTLRPDVERLASVVRDVDAPRKRPIYIFDLASDATFASAYDAAIATIPELDRTRNPWLVTLETTSQPSDSVAIPDSTEYVLARGCAPERCDRGFVSIAYNAATKTVAGAAYYDARWHEFGSDAPADRAMVVLGIARNRLPVPSRFTLDPARSLELRRFVASTGT